MTWTRSVLALAALAAAAVVTSAQSNSPSSSFSQTGASAEQIQDKSVAPPSQETSLPAKGDGDYVGSDTCVTCHEEQGRRFNKTTMGKAMARPHTPDEAHGCESCHGPGRTHVEAGGTKETIPVRLPKTRKTQWPRKTSPAHNATPAKTSCSGWEALTNRGPLLASTATKRIRSVIPPCPMSHASTHRLRKTAVLKKLSLNYASGVTKCDEHSCNALRICLTAKAK